MSMLTAKRWLAIVWLVLGGVAIAVLIAQSLGGRYEDKVYDVWNWLIPALVPTASLVLTAYGAGASNPAAHTARAEPLLFAAALVLSLIYLGLILLTFFAKPFIEGSPLELMALSNVWLGIFQGVLLSVLAALYIT